MGSPAAAWENGASPRHGKWVLRPLCIPECGTRVVKAQQTPVQTHETLYKDFSPSSRSHRSLHGMCQWGEEATEAFPTGMEMLPPPHPLPPAASKISRYISFCERVANHRDFLRRKLLVQGVKFLAFSSC